MRVRHLAEKITHGVVLRRKLTHGSTSLPLYVSSEAGLKFLKPSLEDVDPSLVRWARDLVRPGMDVWDVGGNVGLFAVAAAASSGASGAVLTVEADGYNASLLRRTAQVQPDTSARLTVLPVAVSDRVGFASFDIARRNRATNHLSGYGSSQTGGTREKQWVPTTTLDSLLDYFEPPALVKIDVEGAEALVLRGSERVLSEARPIVLCEVFEETAAEVADCLRTHRYVLMDPDSKRPVDDGDRLPFNVLAIPS